MTITKRISAISIIVFITSISFSAWSLGQHDYSDNHPPSQAPPGDLLPKQVPMFVIIGFDDNGYSGLNPSVNDGGMTWASPAFSSKTNPAGEGVKETFDGEKCLCTFYFATQYIDSWSSTTGSNKKSWWTAIDAGHEPGNHTHNHGDGTAFSVSQWEEEITLCTDWLKKPYDPNESSSGNSSKGIGLDDADLFGFRTPFLKYNENTFTAVKSKGFLYDCSIEEGWQDTCDATNYYWPYTLDSGSPGHDYLRVTGKKDFDVGNHAGLWELPVYPIVIPPDSVCADYQVEPGLRAKLHAAFDQVELATGKIRGLDYDICVDAKATGAEYLACLKYSFDQRYGSNRSPFLFGTHSDLYATNADGWEAVNATVPQLQKAVEDFIAYALGKSDTRVVSCKQFIDWMRDPVPLSGTSINTNQHSNKQTMPKVIIQTNRISINLSAVQTGTRVDAKLYSLRGQLISSAELELNMERRCVWTIEPTFAEGAYIIEVSGVKKMIQLKN